MKKIFLVIAIFLPTYIFSLGWNTSFKKDIMTGKSSAYAYSPSVSSTTKMRSPYNNVKATLGIGCDEKSKWIYVGFTETPNIMNKTIQNGYNNIRTRIKIDDTIEDLTLTQNWGDKFIHFKNGEIIISKIRKSKTLLLELNWYGNGPTYFIFPLNGLSAALEKVEKNCKK